jgi:hypothetical protein
MSEKSSIRGTVTDAVEKARSLHSAQASGLPPRGAVSVAEVHVPDGAGLLSTGVARHILGSATHGLKGKVEAARRELGKPAPMTVTGQPLPHVAAAQAELSAWIERTENLIEKVNGLSDSEAAALASRCTQSPGGYVLPSDYS